MKTYNCNQNLFMYKIKIKKKIIIIIKVAICLVMAILITLIAMSNWYLEIKINDRQFLLYIYQNGNLIIYPEIARFIPF